MGAYSHQSQFERHAHFTAEQTLRGRAIELQIMYLFWESKQPGSEINKTPHAAMKLRESIREELDKQLEDCSPNGRVPRAILGRWLQWLFYFGKEWLSESLSKIFPDADADLRSAAWRAHLLNDGGPVKQLMPQLLPLYMEEASRLGVPRQTQGPQSDRDDDHRDNRFGEYVLIAYLGGDAPDELMQLFWLNAADRVRQHVIWFLGNHLQMPVERLPDDVRARGYDYWRNRLSAGIAAIDKGPYRNELGAIAGWCRHANIPADWLLEQLSLLLNAGFAPTSGYTVVEWLAKQAAENTDSVIKVLEMLLHNKHTEHWTYTTHKDSLRSILAAGLASGSPETVSKTRDAIGYLASIGETEYLHLATTPDAATA